MPAFTPPTVTLLVAAILGLINLWLASRAVRIRYKERISMGDEGNELMRARMRSHANFIEYVPLILILMGLIELRVGPSVLLWLAGLAAIIGRLLHPFGMERPAPNAFRAIGVSLTWLVLLALVLWGLYLAFTPLPGGIRYL